MTWARRIRRIDSDPSASLGAPSSTTTQAPSEQRPIYEKRVRFLAQTVIKVLDNGSVEKIASRPGDNVAWARSLNAFHRAHRIGPRLNQVQLELIASACAVASHYPAAFPDDAYNIIADYLIAKQAQNDERMVEILASLII
jgi:hypothetical protein